ncbi:MAG: sensor histidine kinase, partial [Endomicrobiales bacterium]
RAKLISLSEEVKFLRGQLLAVKKDAAGREKEREALSAENETRKNEIARLQEVRAQEQKRYDDGLEMVKESLREMEKKTQEKRDGYEREKERVAAELLQVEQKTRGASEAEAMLMVRSLGSKLRNMSSSILGSANFMLEKMKRAAQPEKKTGIRRLSGAFLKQGQGGLSDFEPDIDSIFKNTQEMIRVLDMYLALFENPEIRCETMGFLSLWDDLNKKFQGFGAGVRWPQEGKYPVFVTDKKLFTQICEAVVRNALESVPPGGSVTVSGTFSKENVTLTVTDNGTGIKTEYRDRIFLPFFTTKPGHEGMGLTEARRCARALGGSIHYEPGKKGSVFTISIPGEPGDAAKKAS